MGRASNRRHVFCLVIAAALAAEMAAAADGPAPHAASSPTSTSASHQKTDNCADQQSTISKIVCSDRDLLARQRDLQQLATDTTAKFSAPEELDVLAAHQKDWLFTNFWRCANFRFTIPTDPRVAEARECIFKEYERRRHFLTDLPTDVKPQHPYLLSGFERSWLAFDHARSPMLVTSLRRVLTAIITPALAKAIGGSYDDTIFYFAEAANQGVETEIQDNGRYLLGWTFQRHAGFHTYYTIVDLQTGEVVLASSMPDQLTLLVKSCVNQQFEHYAIAAIQRSLAHSAVNSSPLVRIRELQSDECK